MEYVKACRHSYSDEQGKVEFTGTPKEVFRHEKRLHEIGLGVPKVVTPMNELEKQRL